MSFNNVIGGKLNLKGKALDVKGGGAKKKKAKKKASLEQKLLQLHNSSNDAENLGSESAKDGSRSPHGSDGEEHGEVGHEGRTAIYEDHRTPAEKVYDEQRTRLEMKRLAKVASKSHRQKIEEFNQYLANLSEHYDIPKICKLRYSLLRAQAHAEDGPKFKQAIQSLKKGSQWLQTGMETVDWHIDDLYDEFVEGLNELLSLLSSSQQSNAWGILHLGFDLYLMKGCSVGSRMRNSTPCSREDVGKVAFSIDDLQERAR